MNGSGWLHPDFQGNPHLRIFAFEFACSFGFQFCQRGTILHRLLVSVVCSMPCAVVSVGSVVLNLNDKSSLLLVGMVVVAIASLHREYLLVLQSAVLVVHLEVLLLWLLLPLLRFIVNIFWFSRAPFWLCTLKFCFLVYFGNPFSPILPCLSHSVSLSVGGARMDIIVAIPSPGLSVDDPGTT